MSNEPGVEPPEEGLDKEDVGAAVGRPPAILDAEEAGVAMGIGPQLVHGQPGHKKGALKDEGEQDTHQAVGAERPQGRQVL